jgi:hypothetical protein
MLICLISVVCMDIVYLLTVGSMVLCIWSDVMDCTVCCILWSMGSWRRGEFCESGVCYL